MKIPKSVTFVSCLAVGVVVMAVPDTAKAWYSFENTSICSYQTGTPNSSLAWSSSGWTGQGTAGVTPIYCPLSETSATPIHSSNGLWLYGWKGTSSSSATYNVGSSLYPVLEHRGQQLRDDIKYKWFVQWDL